MVVESGEAEVRRRKEEVDETGRRRRNNRSLSLSLSLSHRSNSSRSTSEEPLLVLLLLLLLPLLLPFLLLPPPRRKRAGTARPAASQGEAILSFFCSSNRSTKNKCVLSFLFLSLPCCLCFLSLLPLLLARDGEGYSERTRGEIPAALRGVEREKEAEKKSEDFAPSPPTELFCFCVSSLDLPDLDLFL